MKSYLKIVSTFIMFVVNTISCNEKTAIQKEEDKVEYEFMHENVLKDNNKLLQDVSNIISEHNEDSYILRMTVVESSTCGEIKKNFRNLNNAEKAMVWKDRIIYDLKNK